MPRDRAKALARKKRYLEKLKVAKYGPDAAGVDMRGRHGNHARGPTNHRWRGGRFVTSGGYIAVRVAPTHPHAWGAHPEVRYAYEHILVMEGHLGRAMTDNEIVHHKNHDRTDNRLNNLELLTWSTHAAHHAIERGRDEMGRFPPANQELHPAPETAA